MRAALKSAPLRTAVSYAVFGVLWIALSDRALELLVPHEPSYTAIQTIKGWVFVLVSAVLIYAIVFRSFKAAQKDQAKISALARLISDVSDALFATDLDWRIVTWNLGAERMYGWAASEVIGKRTQEVIHTQMPPGQTREAVLAALERDGRWEGEVIQLRRDGTALPVLASTSVSRSESGAISGYVTVNRDIAVLRRHEEELLRRNRALLTIRACNRALVRARQEDELVLEICQIAVIHGGYRAAWIVYPESPDWVQFKAAASYASDPTFFEKVLKQADGRVLVGSPLDRAIQTRSTIQVGSIKDEPGLAGLRAILASYGYNSEVLIPLLAEDEAVGVFMLYSSEESILDDQRLDLMQELADDLAYGITTIRAREIRRKAEAELAAQQRLLRETEALTRIGGWSYDIVTGAAAVTDEVSVIFGVDPDSFDWADHLTQFAMFPLEDREKIESAFARALATGEPYDLEVRLNSGKGEKLWVRLKARVDMENGTPVRIHGNVMDITERKKSEAKIRQQFERISASREIDQIITATFDERLSLNILLLHSVTLLEVDAARVLVARPPDQTLHCAAAAGFRTKEAEHSGLILGQGYTARAANENLVTIWSPAEDPVLEDLMRHEGFSMLHGAPLMVKGRVIGILEVFTRAQTRRDGAWLDFLSSLANQAAIAIDNATLFRDLQKSNQSMALAYDATIEGLSRALDLRDKETEGHSRRVTEKTLALAKRMDIPQDQLVHIRRGALLHDIGKMGIPDSILHKPGPLSDEEWVQMRRHPQLAYDMLSPIQHLRPALDIPLCHHEKWDGTGYPNGLKGEAIPLAARLFAVVDVWDALMSDRPYRSGWPSEKVLEHIRSQAGTHFDPAVVDMFLRMEGAG